MNLITNWQPNGNYRPWYGEKIAYKATLERRGFKFIHPFRHWGEQESEDTLFACLVQMNDIWAFYLKARDSLQFLKLRLSEYTCFLLNILNMVAVSVLGISNELKSFYYACISCFFCVCEELHCVCEKVHFV